MLEVYRETSNPKKKICHDRTFVSLPNLDKSFAPICEKGSIKFDLRRDEELGRFLYSGRVIIEVQSGLKKKNKSKRKEARKVVVALNYKDNDTLFGYTDIMEDTYGSIDITDEAREWWTKQEYDVPQMNISFYIVSPTSLEKSCDDLYWRASAMMIWQNKPRCLKRLRKPRMRNILNADDEIISMAYEQEEEEDEGNEEEVEPDQEDVPEESEDDSVSGDFEDDSREEVYKNLNDLSKAIQTAGGLQSLYKKHRTKREAPSTEATIMPSSTTYPMPDSLFMKEDSEEKSSWDILMDEQKELFLSSLNKTEQEREEHTKSRSFSELFLYHLLNSEKGTELLQDAQEFIESGGKDAEAETRLPLELGTPNIFSNSKTSGHRMGRKQKFDNEVFLKRQRCSRKKQIIDFDKIQWDWVIAPKQFSSGKCSGKCEFPLDASVNPTNFAILTAIQHHVNGRGRSPCCVPGKMESMTLLYRDTNGHHVVRNFEDMIVKTCMCR